MMIRRFSVGRWGPGDGEPIGLASAAGAHNNILKSVVRDASGPT